MLAPARVVVAALAGLSIVLALAACPPKKAPPAKQRTWKTEPRPVKPDDPPPPRHRPHEHAHGAHPHDGGGHHHHPHPHPHLPGKHGHHHPY